MNDLSTWFFSTDNLEEFRDMWWWIFLWVLFSSIFVYGLAALIGFCTLHKHSQGRWYCLSLAIIGVIVPLTGGIITSAVIAGVYETLAWKMPARVAFIWGAGQTAVAIALSFTRLLPTL
uniref:Transmembrane protein 170B-like n=1 Tax=Phallusia mammillata TaxID=59560 RepID=A0A6F9DUE9_9ASCI|nr:transmembrane protein 170B-like [Phallusia mammillata]